MSNYNSRAIWLPNCNKFLKQLAVSLISYITLPFFHQRRDGVKEFFNKNYYGAPDDLIFDGTSSGYFDRIRKLLGDRRYEFHVILDLGCGQGSLYHWLNGNSIKYKKYMGVDFAITPYEFQNAQFACGNICDIKSYITEDESLAFMCNSLCYIENSVFTTILSSLQKNSGIIVIDPTPNLFWDAHFCGVKPIYRSMKQTCELLQNAGFEIVNTHQDYLLGWKNHYAIGLSYGIFAVKR